MYVGDPKDWLESFRSIDTRFLECIQQVLPFCRALLSKDSDEDTITINLVNILSRNSVARRLFHYLEYQYESIGYTQDGLAYSKGRIDMALILDEDRDHYLAYECKCLNIVRVDGVRSQATRYVMEGVLRFVTEQYASGLPLACMLGYVMNGNIQSARLKVRDALEVNKNDIAILAAPVDNPPLEEIARITTTHSLISGEGSIEIRHAFVPMLL